MKVVVLGAGRRGIRLAKHLIEEKKEVLIIDENPEEVNNAMLKLDCLACVGSGTNIEDLTNAGIDNADVFVSLTNSDETNIVSCAIAASEFHIPVTICVTKEVSYSKTRNFMGISHIINPFQETAAVIFSDIERGIFSDVISFEKSKLLLYNVRIEQGSEYAGKTVKEIRTMIPVQFIITAVMKANKASVPSGDTVIYAGDTLTLAIKEGSLDSILEAIGKSRKKPKRIAIVGGTRIADYLIREFDASKRKNITLIDSHKDVCEDFSSRYPDIFILNENITREGFFQQEDLQDYDLLVAITDLDEQNILIASYAKFKGVKTTVSVIEKNADYLRIADHLNINAIISTQDTSVDSILRFVHGSNVSKLHSLFNGNLEAFEYTVSAKSKLCNKMLQDIDMRGKCVICGIVHQNETIIPNGKYLLCEGDVLLMVAERNFTEFVQNLLKEK